MNGHRDDESAAATQGGVAPASAGGNAHADLLERRFGGLARLYGAAGYTRLRAARFAVVGVGGVGSWAAEALARSGVAELVLVDFDHVAESNVNRQVQALTPTLGQAKVHALAERIALIHPGCIVHEVDEFAAPGNWPALLPVAVDGVVDACDQVRAKEVLVRWGLTAQVPVVVVGAAGGKRRPEAVQVADLAEATHDPLLAALRQRLRRASVMPKPAAGGPGSGKLRTDGATTRAAASGITCVFSREPVAAPLHSDARGEGLADGGDSASCEAPTSGATSDGSLNCAGFGSSVMVTATFGMVAAAAVVAGVLARSNPARER